MGLRVVLSGGGGEEDARPHHEMFASWIEPVAPLLYLPGDAFSADTSFAWLSGVMGSFGVTSITMWANAEDYTPSHLDRYSGIYIGGGNTFRMLNDFVETQMLPGLQRFIEAGKPVFGGSAGAIVLGNDIMTCASMDSNDLGLVSTAGAAVVQDYSIWCHYESSQDQEIGRFMTTRSQPILALSERSGLMIEGSEVQVMEYEGVYRFTHGSKDYIAPGRSFTLVV